MLVLMKLVLLLSLLFGLVSYAGAQLPTPSRQVGYTLGNPSAPVVLEMFADLQCPYCGGSYPTITQVLNHFGGDQVYFVLHFFPLWLHRQATDAAKALAAISQNSPSQTFDAVAYFFKHQTEFFNAPFLNQTEQQLINLFATYAADFGIDSATFNDGYNSESVFTYVDYDVHYAFSRQVTGTPTFFVNGFVNTSLGNSTTYSQWVNYLGGLIGNSKH